METVMNNFLLKLRPYRRWLMLVPLVLSGLWFQLLEKTIKVPEILLYAKLDDLIPFVPVFVVPYVFWYIYVAGPAVFLFWKSPREFTQIATFLALGMFIACAVYTLFPNGQALRPQLSAGIREPFVGLIRFLYLIDTPTNSAPSIHVIYSFAAHAAIVHFNNSRRRIGWINAVSLVISVLCIVSTVFIKQHSIIDVAAGILVSLVLYWVIYKRVGAKSNLGSQV